MFGVVEKDGFLPDYEWCGGPFWLGSSPTGVWQSGSDLVDGHYSVCEYCFYKPGLPDAHSLCRCSSEGALMSAWANPSLSGTLALIVRTVCRLSVN